MLTWRSWPRWAMARRWGATQAVVHILSADPWLHSDCTSHILTAASGHNIVITMTCHGMPAADTDCLRCYALQDSPTRSRSNSSKLVSTLSGRVMDPSMPPQPPPPAPAAEVCMPYSP